MAQIGLAGVGSTLPYVTGPTPSEVPTRRIQDQQSSRPIKEAEESDDGGDNSGEVVLEDERAIRAKENNTERQQDIDSDAEAQVGNQLDISI